MPLAVRRTSTAKAVPLLAATAVAGVTHEIRVAELREAGAVVSELDGGEVNLDTRNLLAAVPALHPVLLEALAYSTD